MNRRSRLPTFALLGAISWALSGSWGCSDPALPGASCGLDECGTEPTTALTCPNGAPGRYVCTRNSAGRCRWTNDICAGSGPADGGAD